MSTDLAGRASRRAILTAAAGGAAALAVSTLAKPFPAAAAAGNMQTETDNATTQPTGVSNSAGDSGALFGTGTTGYGVQGTSTDTSDPETHTGNVGVIGAVGDPTSGDSWAFKGNTGVFGSAPSNVDWYGTGVWGDGDIGVYGGGYYSGVWGEGGAYGVIGQTWGTDTVAVVAIGNLAATADTGGVPARALLVQGRAEFSRSGRSYISAGAASKQVSLSGCNSSTLVIAVLSTNRSGRYIRAVVPTSGSFRVYLNQSVSKKTYFTWIAFTNPSNHLG